MGWSVEGLDDHAHEAEGRVMTARTPWTIERSNEKSTGWRGISIVDADGLHVANLVMQLDDSENEIAKLIVRAVNATVEAAR